MLQYGSPVSLSGRSFSVVEKPVNLALDSL